jgi:hypothetical protein
MSSVVIQREIVAAPSLQAAENTVGAHASVFSPSLSLRVSYEDTYSLLDVSINTTKCIIQQHSSLDSILVAHKTHSRNPPRQPSLDLPSWLPDWRNFPRKTILEHARAITIACGRLEADLPELGARRPTGEFFPDADQLSSATRMIDPSNCAVIASVEFSNLHPPHASLYRPVDSVIISPTRDQPRLRCTGFFLGSLHTAEQGEYAKFQFPMLERLACSDGAFSEFEEYQPQLTGYKMMYFLPSSESVSFPSGDDYFPREGAFYQGFHLKDAADISAIRTVLARCGSCSVPNAATEADLVVMLRGCTLPVVLRAKYAQTQWMGEYVIIGPVFSCQFFMLEGWRRRHWYLWSQDRKYTHKPVPWREDMQDYEFLFG